MTDAATQTEDAAVQWSADVDYSLKKDHTYTGKHEIELGKRVQEDDVDNSQDLFISDDELSEQQWWSVTKYNYFVTVLKYIFQVSVLYWSSFILSNFYFYFTTFQSIRSYFLLHYIS